MSPREPFYLSLPAQYILQMCTATCGFPVDSGDRPLLFILAWLVFPSSHPRFTVAKAQMVSAWRTADWCLRLGQTSLSLRGCPHFQKVVVIGRMHTCTAAHTLKASSTESVVTETCYCYGCGITKESTTMMTENPNRTAHQNSNTANKNKVSP